LPPMAASFILPLALLATSTAYSQGKPTSTNFTSNNFVSLNIGSRAVKTPQATKKVKGQVLTKDGLPLPGVRVSEFGTSNHTQTDFDGNYRLEVSQDAVLNFSYVGFYSEQLTVHAIKDVYTISLRDCINCQEEVIVVAQAIKTLSGSLGNFTVVKNIIETKVDTPEPELQQLQGDTIQIKQDSIVKRFVRGTVIEDAGHPLPGVSIVINGTHTGTQTNFDGNFYIEVAKGQTLVFSYVGFQTKEVAITENLNTLNVEMVENPDKKWVVGGVVAGITIVKRQNVSNLLWPNQIPIDPSKKIPKEELKDRYKNANAFKKIQWEKKKQAKREAREARKKNK